MQKYTVDYEVVGIGDILGLLRECEQAHGDPSPFLDGQFLTALTSKLFFLLPENLWSTRIQLPRFLVHLVMAFPTS